MTLILIARRTTAAAVVAQLTSLQRRLLCRCPTLRTIPWHPVTPYFQGEAAELAQRPFAVLESMPGAPSAYRLTPLGQDVVALCRASTVPDMRQRMLV